MKKVDYPFLEKYDKNQTEINIRKTLLDNSIDNDIMKEFPYIDCLPRDEKYKFLKKRQQAVDLICDELFKTYHFSEYRKIIQREFIEKIFDGLEINNFLLYEPYKIEEIENFEQKFGKVNNIKDFKITAELREYLLDVSSFIINDFIKFNLYIESENKIEDRHEDTFDDHLYKIDNYYYINIISGNIYHFDEDEYEYVIIDIKFKEYIMKYIEQRSLEYIQSSFNIFRILSGQGGLCYVGPEIN